MLLCNLSVQAQNTLTFELNMFRSDSLSKQEVGQFDSGDNGTDIVWNFSRLDLNKNAHHVFLYQDSTPIVTRQENGRVERYAMSCSTTG